jgi:twinkle protein
VVSAMENGDERKAIDECMTKLRMLVQEQKIHLMLVSHLRRGTSDSGHEEGAVVSLSQLRGSAGIAQLSDMVFSLERNGQHDDEDIRNTTTIRVLKNRFSGETGPCCWLKWNKDTGRMSECDAPVTRNNNRRNTKRKKNVVDDFQDMPTNGFKV